MASVNRVFIQGVLGHPPQAHTSRKDGRRYATLNIATTRWVDAGTNSRWETEWHQAGQFWEIHDRHLDAVT